MTIIIFEKKRKIWRYFLIFSAVFFLLMALFLCFNDSKQGDDSIGVSEIEEENFPAKKNNGLLARDLVVETEEDGEDTEDKINDYNDEKELPKKVLLDVPFLSQAPFQKWDTLHENACEEAGLLMVKYFLDGKNNISLSEGEDGIQKIIEYEKKKGYGTSVTVSDLGMIAEGYYGNLNYRVEENISMSDIKKELVGGNPVIVPAAGKILSNPNFRNGGPNYHILVIIGYDEKGFITNDPGTRKGAGFRYTSDNLFEAVHDWDDKNILNGKKRYLILEKNRD